MIGKIETSTAPLGALANISKNEDKRCILFVDESGNAYNFFKYKGKLIDIQSIILTVTLGKKSKEDAVEEIRKGLLYGIKQGECVIFHVGDKNCPVEEFFKGVSFW